MWKGDIALARKLNLDTGLKAKLVQADLKPVKYSIEIIPETERDCINIRTPYFLPETEIFEIVNIIARDIKSL